MAPNIYDIDNPNAGPREAETPPSTPKVKRSKNRETLTSTEHRAGKQKLADMVDAAFRTLEDAMTHADHPTAIKAAQVILDRAGFGPKSTVEVNTNTADLSNMTREELAERAMQISRLLRPKAPVIDISPIPPPPSHLIQ